MSNELGQRNEAGHRVWTKDGETIVSTRWVEGWATLLDGSLEFNRCGCDVTSCEHDSVRRRLAHVSGDEPSVSESALKTAARAVVAAWDDEIGQVEGALIDELRRLLEPAP